MLITSPHKLINYLNICHLLIDYAGRKIDKLYDLTCICQQRRNSVRDNEFETFAEVWMVEESLIDCNVCTRELFTNESIIQPMYVVVDTTFSLCVGCLRHFDSSMYRLATDCTQPFICSADQASDFGMSLSPIIKSQLSSCSLAAPVQLFLKRLYLSRYMSFQNSSSSVSTHSNDAREEEAQFRSRLRSRCQTVKVYEDPTQQLIARSVIDIGKVCIYAEEYREQSNRNSLSSPAPPDVCWMHGLMRWFKVDFFLWCNKPPCDHCTTLGSAAPPKAGMEMIGMAEPTPFERDTCWAHRVEVK